MIYTLPAQTDVNTIELRQLSYEKVVHRCVALISMMEVDQKVLSPSEIVRIHTHLWSAVSMRPVRSHIMYSMLSTTPQINTASCILHRLSPCSWTISGLLHGMRGILFLDLYLYSPQNCRVRHRSRCRASTVTRRAPRL